MTFHFAYPNVLPRQGIFLGCGRYTVSTPGNTPGEAYSEVHGVPNTPNKNILSRAVQLLAPESFDSTKVLFHKQDQQDKKYQGDSLDLAWFLTHILRARQLGFQAKSDIWCTGVLQVDGSGSHLLDVEQCGFDLKLQAFLDPANKDLVFIVPLPNLTSQARKISRKHNITILRINDATSNDFKELSDQQHKKIIAVAADELQVLLKALFIPPAFDRAKGRKANKLKWSILFLLLTVVIGFANLPFKSSPDSPILPVQKELKSPKQLQQYQAANLISKIRQGDFSLVLSFLEDDQYENNEELLQLRQQLTTPLTVQGELQYLFAKDKKTGDIPNEDNVTQIILTHSDRYRYIVNVTTPIDALYLYLLQVDSFGNLTPLFPNSQFDTRNPVRPWHWPVSVPGKEDEWIYLNQLPETTKQLTQEIVYLLVSPWPADDIEALGLQLSNNPQDEAIKAQLLARISLRQKAALPSIFSLRWSFLHGQ